MILVLAGTGEGRQAASALTSAGFKVTASTATEYGKKLLNDCSLTSILCGQLNEDQLSCLLDKGFDAVIDATHPYAVNITRTLLELCSRKKVNYIRLERPAAEIPDHPLVRKAYDFNEAVELAIDEEKTLFSTLGSKNLPVIVEKAARRDVRVIARVLPDPEVLFRCRDMGLSPAQIIAVQGPFSRGLNRELFLSCGTGVVITKESGSAGGVENKINAAVDLEIPIVIWMRPCFEYPMKVNSPEEVVFQVNKIINNE
ncbi:MAG: precorrin-6A reductase [Clostridiales bacterium]|nr:precorrin-6A reductase [Clostridiales bacterium]MCF8022738.1 precorrin-6A reductase [Clostridiales bacterium]